MDMARAAAAVGQVPDPRDLFTTEPTITDQVLRQAAVHRPSPAPAAARTTLVRIPHGVVISRLLLGGEGCFVELQEAGCQGCRNVVWIGGDQVDVDERLEPFDLPAIAVE